MRHYQKCLPAMNPKFVDLFSGIGLGSLGLVRAGFEIAAAVDIDPEACAVYKENLGVEPIVGDLRHLSGSDILKRIGLRRWRIIAVRGLSSVSRVLNSEEDAAQEMGERWAQIAAESVCPARVDELFPKIVVFENVRGITLGQNRRFLKDFMAHMKRLGYYLDFRVLDSAYYGVPQHRLRFILVGSRELPPSLPEETHSNPRSDNEKPRWKTVRDAIADLPPLEAGQRDENIALHEAAAHSENALRIICSIPANGGGRKSLPKKLWLPCHRRLAKRKQRGAESIYGRMRWDEPSPTITTRSHIPSCGRFVHPSQNRGITLREAARLQNIPDDFKIRARAKDQAAIWIGNAMPLALAEALGREIIHLI